MAIKEIKHRQFIAKVAKETKCSEATVDKIIATMIDVLAEELRVTGVCTIRNFGRFSTQIYTGRFIKPQHIWVDDRLIPKVKFSDNFKDLVNGRIVTRQNRKLERQDNLSKKLQQKVKKIKDSQMSEVQQMLKNMVDTGETVGEQIDKKRQAENLERQRKKEEELLKQQRKEEETRCRQEILNSI